MNLLCYNTGHLKGYADEILVCCKLIQTSDPDGSRMYNFWICTWWYPERHVSRFVLPQRWIVVFKGQLRSEMSQLVVGSCWPIYSMSDNSFGCKHDEMGSRIRKIVLCRGLNLSEILNKMTLNVMIKTGLTLLDLDSHGTWYTCDWDMVSHLWSWCGIHPCTSDVHQSVFFGQNLA